MDVITTFCNEADVQIPDGFSEEFLKHFRDMQIGSFNAVNAGLCRRADQIMKSEPSLGEKFGEFVDSIRYPVRLRLAVTMGLDKYVGEPMRGFESSPREVLVEFLGTLDEGQAWDLRELEKYGSGAGDAGRILVQRVSAATGRLGLEAVKVLLGAEFEGLLERNPFAGKHRFATSMAGTRRYLKSFLKTLPVGEPWSYASLERFAFDDGYHGAGLERRIATDGGDACLDEAAVRKILGDRADELLKRNPFEKKSAPGVLKTVADARKYLVLFLDSLADGESWSPSLLAKSTKRLGSDGPAFSSLYTFICQNFGHNDEVDWLFVLVELVPFKYLERNPFMYMRGRLISVRPRIGRPARRHCRHDADVRLHVERLRDPSAFTPEDLLLKKEERELLGKRFSALQRVVNLLSPAERKIISVFYDSGDIPDSVLNPIISWLKSLMFVYYPEFFGDDETLDFGLEVLRSLLV